MFSGIVAAVGRIEHIEPLADGIRLTVDTNGLDLADVIVGDSIAHSGVCLTVVEMNGPKLKYDVSRETLNCTIGLDAVGNEVNLEKALRLADRLGGHLVTGHVDGVGEVVKFAPIGESHELVIRAPAAIAGYIAKKGSITVNGVSLTVNSVEDCADGSVQFELNIIPHTCAVTTLGDLQTGSEVNLEVDTIARYLHRMQSLRAS